MTAPKLPLATCNCTHQWDKYIHPKAYPHNPWCPQYPNGSPNEKVAQTLPGAAPAPDYLEKRMIFSEKGEPVGYGYIVNRPAAPVAVPAGLKFIVNDTVNLYRCKGNADFLHSNEGEYLNCLNCNLPAPPAPLPPPQEPTKLNIGGRSMVCTVCGGNTHSTIFPCRSAGETRTEADEEEGRAGEQYGAEEEAMHWSPIYKARIAQLERENRDWRESATVVRAALTQAQAELQKERDGNDAATDALLKTNKTQRN